MAEEFSGFESLTGREADVLACLVEDLSNSEIADRLFLSASTVKWYVRQLNAKLNTSNRYEIVDRARSLGLLVATRPTEHSPKYNLPHQMTPFVGRDAELDELAQIIGRPDCRLVTILAPGGMGKSRLGLEAAKQQVQNFRDGVYFVPLQPLTDVEQIIPAVAQQIGFLWTADARPPKQQLLDYLGGKQMLLIIDNWEHLLDGALLVTEILQAAPGVRVLATSRERLNLSGETVYGLRGMQFPAWETPQDAWQYDAVKLLVQAARRVLPDFDLTTENLDYIARICRLTEGMPLGILLAMSWLDTLSLERIADEIVRSLDFLETEMRDVSERHRSLRAVLETAWERLKPDEQQIFMTLCVFRGGFMLEAAETISGANLRTMQSLVNKAFLVRTRTGRYDIHELLRQYGYRRLEAIGTLADVLRQHGAFFAGFLHAREPDLKGKRQLEALHEIAAELDNIRQGWGQALQDEQVELIEQSAFPLEMYLNSRSRQLEFVSLFADAERLLRPRFSDHRSFGKLLITYGIVLFGMGRYQEIEALARQGMAIARAHDDRLTIAYGCHLLAMSVIGSDRDEALALCDEGIRICEQLGHAFELAHLLLTKAGVCAISGKYDATAMLSRQALEIQRREGDELGMARALLNLATAADLVGHLDEFEARMREVLAVKVRFNEPQGIAQALREFGGIEFQKGNVDAARDFVEKSLGIGRNIALPQEIAMSQLYQAVIDVVSGRFDDAEQKAEAVLKLETVGTSSLYFLVRSLARLGLGDLLGAKNAVFNSLRQKTGDEVIGQTPVAILTIGLIVAGQGQPERGLELASVALNDRRMQKSLANSVLVTTRLEAIRNQLTDTAYAAAWERGKAREMQATVSELLQAPGDDATVLY